MTATELPAAPPPARSRSPKRYASVFVVFALGAALVGYLRGIQPPPPLPRPPELPDTPAAAPPAVSYSELPLTRRTPDLIGVFDRVVRTEEMKQAALADRAKNRAYDTAPPTIPHPTDGMTAASCLACHGPGIRAGDKIATKVSHPHYTNCVQCHAPAAPPELAALATPVAENDFAGAIRSGPGSRAAPGAPPTIPHTTWMRQDCASCHGLVARPGIRTTHPWLTNCTQCHAPSAELDQVAFPFLNGGRP